MSLIDYIGVHSTPYRFAIKIAATLHQVPRIVDEFLWLSVAWTFSPYIREIKWVKVSIEPEKISSLLWCCLVQIRSN